MRENKPEVKSNISSFYTDKIELSDSVTIVNTKETSSSICEKIGLLGDGQISGASGAVIRLQGAYSGHTIIDLWDWLDQHKDDF